MGYKTVLLLVTLILYCSVVHSEDYNEILRNSLQDIELLEKEILGSNDIGSENDFDEHLRFKRYSLRDCMCPPGPKGDIGEPGPPGIGDRGMPSLTTNEIYAIIDKAAADVCPRVC